MNVRAQIHLVAGDQMIKNVLSDGCVAITMGDSVSIFLEPAEFAALRKLVEPEYVSALRSVS